MRGLAARWTGWGAPSFIQVAPEFLRDKPKQNVNHSPRHLNMRRRLIGRSSIAGRKPQRVVKVLSDGRADGFIDSALRLSLVELVAHKADRSIDENIIRGRGGAG